MFYQRFPVLIALIECYVRFLTHYAKQFRYDRLPQLRVVGEKIERCERNHRRDKTWLATGLFTLFVLHVFLYSPIITELKQNKLMLV